MTSFIQVNCLKSENRPRYLTYSHNIVNPKRRKLNIANLNFLWDYKTHLVGPKVISCTKESCASRWHILPHAMNH